VETAWVSGRAPLAIRSEGHRHCPTPPHDRLRPSRSWQPTPWKAL
jgi:hypothetical protein